MLPCDKMHPLLGVSARTISEYRRFALADDYLRLAKSHSTAERSATEFRFNLACFPELTSWATAEALAAFRALPAKATTG